MARMHASPQPTVVVVGDSTATQNAANLVSDDLLYYKLTTRLRQDNPGKTFNFRNYAVAGTSWTTFNGVPTNNYPSWYFNRSLPWLAYVKASNADTLFINFGVNDAERFRGASLRTALEKIAAFGTPAPGWQPDTSYALHTIITDSNGRLQICSEAGISGTTPPEWGAAVVGITVTDGTGSPALQWQLLNPARSEPKVPDIILITNKNNNALAGPPYNTALNQNGTIAAAAYQRTLALSNANTMCLAGLPPLGLIDIGRQFTMAYNGYDPVSPVFTAVTVAQSPIRNIADFPYVLPATPAGSFEVQLTVSHGSAFTGAQKLRISVGEPGWAPGNYVQIQPTGSGGNVVVGYANGANVLQTITCAGGWRLDENVLTVTAHDDHLMVQVNDIVVWDSLVPRSILPDFTPTISFPVPPPAPEIALNIYSIACFRPTSRTIPDAAACYGGIGTTPFQGGNGVNHNASFALNAVDALLLESVQFGP